MRREDKLAKGAPGMKVRLESGLFLWILVLQFHGCMCEPGRLKWPLNWGPGVAWRGAYFDVSLAACLGDGGMVGARAAFFAVV